MPALYSANKRDRISRFTALSNCKRATVLRAASVSAGLRYISPVVSTSKNTLGGRVNGSSRSVKWFLRAFMSRQARR